MALSVLGGGEGVGFFEFPIEIGELLEADFVAYIDNSGVGVGAELGRSVESLLVDIGGGRYA